MKLRKDVTPEELMDSLPFFKQTPELQRLAKEIAANPPNEEEFAKMESFQLEVVTRLMTELKIRPVLGLYCVCLSACTGLGAHAFVREHLKKGDQSIKQALNDYMKKNKEERKPSDKNPNWWKSTQGTDL
jgi:hypothetical protein